MRLFVEEGARVAFADRDGDRGAAIAEEINGKGGDVLFVQAHMEREAEAMAFVQGAVDHFGQLHILVNNVAMRLYQTVVEATRGELGHDLGGERQELRLLCQSGHPLSRRYGATEAS